MFPVGKLEVGSFPPISANVTKLSLQPLISGSRVSKKPDSAICYNQLFLCEGEKRKEKQNFCNLLQYVHGASEEARNWLKD